MPHSFTEGDTQSSLSVPLTVGDAPLGVVGTVPTLSATEGQALSDVALLNLQDFDPAGQAGDFTATA